MLSRARLWVHVHIKGVVTLAAVEQGPQHSALPGLTSGEAAVSPMLLAATGAVLI